MRFILKFTRPAFIAAFAFFALFPLTMYSQDAAKTETHGIAVDNMDPSVRPGDDFYDYANGNWIKRTEIPPDRSRIGVFTALDDLSNKRTEGLIDEAVKANARERVGQPRPERVIVDDQKRENSRKPKHRQTMPQLLIGE